MYFAYLQVTAYDVYNSRERPKRPEEPLANKRQHHNANLDKHIITLRLYTEGVKHTQHCLSKRI